MRVIAIDGPAGSGKSTVARRAGRAAWASSTSTPARCTGRHVRRSAPRDRPGRRRRRWRASSTTLELEVRDDGVTVDGVDATIEIRGPEVTRAVSIVAANPAVRTEMVRRQREWAEEHGGGVIEGRDIGIGRVPRRRAEGVPDRRARGARRPPVQGGHRPRLRDGRRRPRRRDALDQGRDDSPLTRGRWRIVVDTSDLTVDEIVDACAQARLDRSKAGPVRRRRRDLAGTGRPGAAHLATAWCDGLVLSACLVGFARCSGASRSIRHENVPADGAFILAPIHRSNIDFAVVAVVTPSGRCATWPRTRSGSQAARPVRVDRARRFPGAPGHGRPRGAADLHRGPRRRRAARDVPRGDPPDGPDGRGRCSTARRSWHRRTGVPIVPVGIGGTETVMPKGAKMHPTRTSSSLVVGEPIPAARRPEGSEGPPQLRSRRRPSSSARRSSASSTSAQEHRRAPEPAPVSRFGSQSSTWRAKTSRTIGSKCSSGMRADRRGRTPSGPTRRRTARRGRTTVRRAYLSRAFVSPPKWW